MNNAVITIRSGEYDIAKAELWNKHRSVLLAMIGDLLGAGMISPPDYKTDHGLNMAINARFNEVTGDAGRFIGTIPEIVSEAAPLWKEYADRVAELVDSPDTDADKKLNASTMLLVGAIGNDLDALYDKEGM